MPLKLTTPLYEEFQLVKSDNKYGNEDDDPTMITVKQAAQGEHEVRQALFSKLEQRWNQLEPEEISLVQNISFEEVKRLEVYLSMVECNMLDMDDKPLFPSKKDGKGDLQLAMSKQQFARAWAKIIPDVAQEIHEKVLELNPLWNRQVGEDS